MGQIGRWIDSLDDAQRDRIIEHPDPTYDGIFWWDEDRDCGCLVGCAVQDTSSWNDSIFGRHPSVVLSGSSEWDYITYYVGTRFPRFTIRFTPERMWRVVKARAARANRITLPAPTTPKCAVA